MRKFLYLCVLTMASVCLAGASCPAVCECTSQQPACPPGVSLVPDSCSCCKVCAAQLNQDCSAGQPCDHHKGLECNYGNDVTLSTGVCRAKLEGRSCDYNGRIYQNGESFRVGCSHHCTCIDGALGCGPLCTTQLPLATPSCPYPRLVRVPGECCFSVDCHKGEIGPPEPPRLKRPRPRPRPHKPGNELTNELEGRAIRWENERGYNHLPVWTHFKKQCVIQTTDWSQCSRSCGMGVSSRVTNDNAQCKLVRETRLCNLRPCSLLTVSPKKGKKCTRTFKSSEPIRLTFAGCRSDRLYRPNYCGVCVDGRCCTPQSSRTVTVAFVCPGGQRLEKPVMFIQSCKCSHGNCGHLNEVAMPPQRWLYGDTHKFID